MTMNETDISTPAPNTLYFDDIQHGVQPSILVSDSIRHVLEPALIHARLLVNTVGVITNIINIRVFLEQGVRNDSTNIGFVCLSIWDLLSCVTLIPIDCCFLITYTNGIADHRTCIAFATIIGAQAHVAFQNISRWTTVYISLMRCLCVMFPLKVKFMLTPKCTIYVIASIFVCFTSVQVWSSAFLRIVWEYSPALNTTVASLRDSQTSRTILYYKLLILNQILPAIAMVIVSINTAIMGHKLLEVKKWRQTNSSTTTEQSGEPNTKPTKQMTSKEIQLVKFINTVTGVFIVCGLVGFLPTVTLMVVPGVSYTGINNNLFYIVFEIRSLIDIANASINFFFYIRVSSRYKSAFQTSFKLCMSQD